ncbi:hypothetical protein [Glaciimonas soli]|uniref:Transmembrane protein n=1 Tax=Glaciimonas soli TaxID=2590999 RepID=A0A843YMZ5_9BURK|nr:hypothetical protein [Glaciimonas soli]MQQ99143.1 hypothetical protein [Glaciimonas soli]
MYIIAIGWIYVVFMMSITESSAAAGVMTFLFYGVLPLAIVLYLMGTPQRKRNRQRAAEQRRLSIREEIKGETIDDRAKKILKNVDEDNLKN